MRIDLLHIVIVVNTGLVSHYHSRDMAVLMKTIRKNILGPDQYIVIVIRFSLFSFITLTTVHTIQ